MTSAVVQAPAGVDVVVEALGTLAPGWRDRTGISHAEGWTSVPMRADAAGRFAPLLARLLGTNVLRWEDDGATCRVTFFQPDGEVVGPADAADTEALEAFAKTFARRQVLHVTPTSGGDRTRLLGEASAASGGGTGQQAHRAFASVLGVPYPAPATPADSNPSVPVLSEASVLSVAAPLQRRRQLEQARHILKFVVYAAVVGAVASVFEPGWPVNALVIAVALVLFGIWYGLGWRLKKLRQEQQTAS
ncbi:hypothetical protein SAMN04489717_0912 [Actinopolymorpha singaporensis]|uniref:Uncharacterized protein n=2 Tax=Actinopolymorpha singaporensis TaxID=117157 RepID=A0A1H1MQ19_9ACTN|nr:hypothetical protein SAMN04489717_0912 [Actinopolymorpha singaporensis]